MKKENSQKNLGTIPLPVPAIRKHTSTVYTKQVSYTNAFAIDHMEAENKKANRLKDQIRALRSGNRLAILDTVKELRIHGDVSILPELFDLLVDREDLEVKSEIASLLNDLKDKEAVLLLTEAIANPEYSQVQSTLVSACWQNGLSYGKHISTFVEVISAGDYEAAIEAFTVIEEAIGEIEEEERNRLADQLKSLLNKIDDQKKPLLSELIKVVTNY